VEESGLGGENRLQIDQTFWLRMEGDDVLGRLR
jgi:hypothetical protein